MQDLIKKNIKESLPVTHHSKILIILDAKLGHWSIIKCICTLFRLNSLYHHQFRANDSRGTPLKELEKFDQLCIMNLYVGMFIPNNQTWDYRKYDQKLSYFINYVSLWFPYFFLRQSLLGFLVGRPMTFYQIIHNHICKEPQKISTQVKHLCVIMKISTQVNFDKFLHRKLIIFMPSSCYVMNR